MHRAIREDERKTIERKSVAAVPALATLIAALSFAGTARAAEPTVPTLVVTAAGEVSATPDQAIVTAGVVAEGRTTAEAMKKADEAANALLAEAKAAGVDKADVATVDFSVTPVWASQTSSSSAPRRITGYTVADTFTLKVRRIADLGPLLERLVANGANTVSDVAFEASDADRRRDEARVAAVTTARARAELLANAAGERLVRVLSMNEEGGERPTPRVFAKAMAAPSAAVPVEAGTRTISATVTMTFELAPRETK